MNLIIIFVLQGAAAPREVEGSRDWKSVDSSLASKSVDDMSLVLNTVDGRLPLKANMDMSKSELNHKIALKVDHAEAGFGQNKVTNIKWTFFLNCYSSLLTTTVNY